VRVSTDEQAVLEFNSLQAQEQICRTYISMRDGDPATAERWEQADTYSDSGYSGGTLERPALRRLLTDVEAGRVDTILIYKIDRLSRSIHQFYRIWELLEHYHVDLVSATQDLNTSTSQGKLMLNMLLSFGQFEREQISERTRDKVAAARKMGRWTGGMPILGYDVDPRGGRLIVNEKEAGQVREVFALYLRERSLTKAVEELNRRGWRRKSWIKRDGAMREGSAFDKPGLLNLLKNPLYVGRVPHRGALHPGEHAAIVDEAVWNETQTLLRRNGAAGYQGSRERDDSILKGLLRCACCDCSMSPTYTLKGNRRYRYYLCQSVLKRGSHSCPTGRVPAHEIEAQVVERIRTIGRDPDLLAATVRQAQLQHDELVACLKTESRELRRELRGKRATLKRYLATTVKSGRLGHVAAAKLPAVEERVAGIEARLSVLSREIDGAKRLDVTEPGIRSTLEAFGPVWQELWPSERARILGLLVKEIDYDGRDRSLSVRIRPDGIDAQPT
jgi:site-specific DNA recombinase